MNRQIIGHVKLTYGYIIINEHTPTRFTCATRFTVKHTLTERHQCEIRRKNNIIDQLTTRNSRTANKCHKQNNYIFKINTLLKASLE